MRKYLLPLFIAAILGNCKGKNVETKKVAKLIDTIYGTYSDAIHQKEQASIEKKPANIGEIIKNIEFRVRTKNTKDFKDGIIPWANLERPEADITNLIDKDVIVIKDTAIKIIIDYPLTNPYEFKLSSTVGFTRSKLLREISKHYFILYAEEEKSATIKTLPMSQRKMYNRNETNGIYGIWGHDIADLVLDEIVVYRTPEGQIVLTLEIES